LNRTKVLIVCSAGIVSGKEIMTLELARGLKASGLDVHVLTSTWGDRTFPLKLEAVGLPFDELPLGFISATLTLQCLEWTYGQLERWPDLLSGYMSLLQTLQPDKVIHTNWQHLLLLLPFLNADRDWFWVHEVMPAKRQYRILFQALNRRLQGFIPVSCAVSESLKRLGISEQQMRVIYNGLNDLALNAQPPSKPDGAIRLGIVGQVNRWKGHEDLFEAFGQIGVQWPNTELHIFGQGSEDYGRQLKRQSIDLGIADQVRWHGYVNDRTAIFQSIDLLVIPSRVEESFGLVAAEAGFFALPMVATRQGGLAEIIEDGITGILVPANDPTALVAGIQRLLVDPGLRFSMGVRARQRMLDHFSNERFINGFLSLLEVQAIDNAEVRNPR
jgi:glycosyltransferase involved in cell wall biosynthesis